MDIATARKLVADDQRQSYSDMTDEEAIAHARNTIGVGDINLGTDWDDADDAHLGAAYITVLEEVQ